MLIIVIFTFIIIGFLTYTFFLNEKNRKLTIENEKLKFLIEEKEKNLVEISNIKEQLSNQFKIVSNEIIEKQKEIFNREQKNGLNNILDPLKEQLENYDKKIQESKEVLIENSSSMKTQINLLMEQSKKIGNDANNLTMALKNDKKAQGNWGELKLKNILEFAGFKEGVDYTSQKSEINQDGKNSVLDFVVQLPGNRKLIIDSKVSIINYERYINSQNKEEQKQFLEAYHGDIKNHIKELGSKEYYKLYGNDTPDFVFMFLPLERAYFDVIDYDITVKQSELFNKAIEKRVNIVTGSSLISVLKMIEHLWSIEKQNKNIEEIIKLAGEMHEKVSNFAKSMNDIRNHLQKAMEFYNNAVKQLKDGKGNVLTIANKINNLTGKKNIIEIESLPESND